MNVLPLVSSAFRPFSGFCTHPRKRERPGGNMPDESDVYRQQQYVKVLREVTAGDTLGPAYDDDTHRSIRKFELSGNPFPVKLIDRMIAERLLVSNGDRGVVIAAAGERFFFRYR